MKGVGNGGVVQDGLFFIVDAFNLKSYIPPIGTPTTSNATGSSYTGFTLSRVSDSTQQPVVFGIAGNVQSAWTGYINNGSISLILGGGSASETYSINNALYVSSTNTTALYPDFTANFVTMSHTHSMGNWYGGGTNFIKMSGDFETIFNIYLSNTTPLVFSLTGGGGPIIGVTASGASYSGFALNRVSDNTQKPIVIGVSGDQSALYSSYISGNGGTLSMSLSGGSMSEVFDVTTALYNGYNNTTILYRTPSSYVNSVTMSGTCSIDNSYGPFFINISGNSEAFINTYFNGGSNELMFNLTGGATAESFTASTAFFDGTNTIIHDSGWVGAMYSDHIQFQVLVPDMIGTLYTDNTTFTFSYPYSPETYSVNAVYYDGVNTYLYDTGYIGSSYDDHTQFQVLVPEMLGTLYSDHTNATYSYSIITPQTASYDMTERNHNCELSNGVGFDGRSFVFDGIDDNINVGSLGNLTSYTMNLWFKSSSVVDYKNIIDFNGDNDGVRVEQYTSPGYTAIWSNLGYSGVARISITLDSSGGFGIGGDCIGDIVEDEWYNLVISYKTSPAIASPLTNVFTYDGYGQYWSQGYGPYIAAIVDADPSVAQQWNGYISAAGGVLDTNAFQSFGTYSVTYSITGVYYQPPPTPGDQSITYFLGFDANNFETRSWGVSVDNIYLGFNSLIIGSYSTIEYYRFQETLSVATSLTFSLLSGTYSEDYVVDSVTNDSVNIYLYDSGNVGTTYNMYTQSTTSMPVPFSLGWLFGTPSIPSPGYDRISATAFGNVCSVYLNGDKIIDQWVWSGNFIGYINDMRIGDGYNYSDRRFQGSIPYVALYNKSLSDEEIYNNYNSLKWRFI